MKGRALPGVRLVLIGAGFLALSACELTLLSAPSVVETGQSATFTFRIDQPLFPASEESLVCIRVDYPTRWVLAGAQYVGVLNGESVEGVGLKSGDPGICLPVPLADGYARTWVCSPPLAALDTGDFGVVDLTFEIGGDPGEYAPVFHGFGRAGPFNSDCSSEPVEVEVAQGGTTLDIPVLGIGGRFALIVLMAVSGIVAARLTRV